MIKVGAPLFLYLQIKLGFLYTIFKTPPKIMLLILGGLGVLKYFFGCLVKKCYVNI
jgi:hypothetical protein